MGSPPSFPPQLSALKQQLLDARERAHRLGDGLTPESWAARPSAGGWSIGECLMHLNITTERFLPLIDEAVRHGRARNLTGPGPYSLGVIGWVLVRAIEPPYRLRTRTPPSFAAARVEPISEVLARFDYLQQELLTRVDSAAGLALNRLRVTSPIDGRVKYNLMAAFTIIPTHQRRHLWQAEQAKARLAGGAPAAAGR